MLVLTLSNGRVLSLNALQLFMDAGTGLAERHSLGELQLSEFSEQENIFQRYSKSDLHHLRHPHISVLQWLISEFLPVSYNLWLLFSYQAENCKFELPTGFSLSFFESYRKHWDKTLLRYTRATPAVSCGIALTKHLQSIIEYTGHLWLRAKFPLMWLHRLRTRAAKKLLEMCMLLRTGSCCNSSPQLGKRDFWPPGLVPSFVQEGKALPQGSCWCFKAFLCPAGSSLMCLTNLHGYLAAMSLMASIFKPRRYKVSDGSHKCTEILTSECL